MIKPYKGRPQNVYISVFIRVQDNVREQYQEPVVIVTGGTRVRTFREEGLDGFGTKGSTASSCPTERGDKTRRGETDLELHTYEHES